MGKAKRESREPSHNITPLLEPITALQRLLDHFNNQGVIIGGIAASLLGKPRLTADLDAVVLLSIQDLPRLIAAAAKQDMIPRIPDAETFARKNRILLLRHQPSGTNVDISLGVLPFEVEMVARSQKVNLENIQLQLPSPEDLIIIKAVAHRPKDLEDIRAIAASHPDLDQEQVRYWVEQFGEALDLSDLWDTIQNLLIPNGDINP
jgi:hypothetical protein